MGEERFLDCSRRKYLPSRSKLSWNTDIGAYLGLLGYYSATFPPSSVQARVPFSFLLQKNVVCQSDLKQEEIQYYIGTMGDQALLVWIS